MRIYGELKKSIIVESDIIEIKTEGGLFSGERTKTIQINRVNSVQVKKPKFIYNGYISITIAGGQELRDTMFEKSETLARLDENSVCFFGEDNYNMALKMKEYIESYDKKSNEKNLKQNISVADEILKFKNLLDIGIITKEEFIKKKEELLNS